MELVEVRRRAWRIENRRVVDEEIASLGEPGEVVVLRGQVPGHDDSASGMLDAVGDGGCKAVVDRNGRHAQIALSQDLADGRILRDWEIDRLDLEGVPKLRQIREGAVSPEQAADEGRRARIVTASAGPEDAKAERLVVAEIARLHEGGKVAAVVDVQVGEQHRVEAMKINAKLPESHEGAGTDVDENARDTVEKNKVARRGATEADRASRPEHDELEARAPERQGDTSRIAGWRYGMGGRRGRTRDGHECRAKQQPGRSGHAATIYALDDGVNLRWRRCPQLQVRIAQQVLRAPAMTCEMKPEWGEVIVQGVYTLLTRRDLAMTLRACRVAKETAETLEDGAHRLALVEAVVDGLDGFLSELGEHGSEPLWATDYPLERGEIGRLAADCAAALADARRLRGLGFEPDPQLLPIGSRDWLETVTRAVAHRDADWVARVERRVDEEGWFSAQRA